MCDFSDSDLQSESANLRSREEEQHWSGVVACLAGVFAETTEFANSPRGTYFKGCASSFSKTCIHNMRR